MGDRRQVIVKDGASTVYLYSHWDGYDLPETVSRALQSQAGKARWMDGAYLTRIIFCNMVRSDVLGETGFGISSEPLDSEYGERDIIVDVGEQRVRVGRKSWPFAEFNEAAAKSVMKRDQVA